MPFFLPAPPPAIVELLVVEARYRRRYTRKAAVIVPPLPSDLGPKKVRTLDVIEDENGRFVFVRSGRAGIEDVYSRVPPFNAEKPPNP